MYGVNRLDYGCFGALCWGPHSIILGALRAPKMPSPPPVENRTDAYVFLFLFSYFFLNTNNHGNPFSRFLDINNNPPSGYLSTHEYYSRLNGSRKKVIETKKNDNSLQLKQVISQNNMNNYSINIIPSNSLFQESHTTTTP